MCSSSTSLSSSTASSSSSTASIVSLAEGEAATSLVLQDNVISVLSIKGGKLFADQDIKCASSALQASVSCAHENPAAPANCMQINVSEGRDADATVAAAATVPAADYVLLGVSKSRAARGRYADATAAAADADVPAADYALPGVEQVACCPRSLCCYH